MNIFFYTQRKTSTFGCFSYNIRYNIEGEYTLKKHRDCLYSAREDFMEKCKRNHFGFAINNSNSFLLAFSFCMPHYPRILCNTWIVVGLPVTPAYGVKLLCAITSFTDLAFINTTLHWCAAAAGYSDK